MEKESADDGFIYGIVPRTPGRPLYPLFYVKKCDIPDLIAVLQEILNEKEEG